MRFLKLFVAGLLALLLAAQPCAGQNMLLGVGITGTGIIPGVASTFVGAAQTTNAAGGAGITLNKPAGLATGDFAVVMTGTGTGSPSITGGSGGWSSYSYPGTANSVRIFYKVLTASDVASTLTYNGLNYYMACFTAYRGATQLAVQSTVTASSASPVTGTSPGFTKISINGGIVSTVWSSMSPVGSTALTAPGAMSSRSTTSVDTGLGEQYACGVADQLSGYASGSLAWTATLGGSSGPIIIQNIEIY